MSDYPDSPGCVAGSHTSEAAADSMLASASTLRVMIWKHALGCGQHGIICDEVEAGLGMRHQTASARIRELDLSGDLIKTDRKRATRSGRNAFVYVAARRNEIAA